MRWFTNWRNAGSSSRKAFASALLALLSGVLVLCALGPIPNLIPHKPSLDELEKNLHRVPRHISEFSPVSEPLALPKCGDVRQPEALLTPDPALHGDDDNLNVRVSFIIGSDGHVHSAFIMDSAGFDDDQAVLRTVRMWRYRPALCNGVPTDSEARVRFTVR